MLNSSSNSVVSRQTEVDSYFDSSSSRRVGLLIPLPPCPCLRTWNRTTTGLNSTAQLLSHDGYITRDQNVPAAFPNIAHSHVGSLAVACFPSHHHVGVLERFCPNAMPAPAWVPVAHSFVATIAWLAGGECGVAEDGDLEGSEGREACWTYCQRGSRWLRSFYGTREKDNANSGCSEVGKGKIT